jgi:hypothetical protein
MATLFGLHPFLLKLYADGGYQGPIFQSAVRKILRQIDVEIVKRSDIAKALRSCPSDGSSNAPSPGSTAAAAWPRIGSASTERPWRSCAWPQSASCCESSVKKHHDPGQTLRNYAVAGSSRLEIEALVTLVVVTAFKVFKMFNGGRILASRIGLRDFQLGQFEQSRCWSIPRSLRRI